MLQGSGPFVTASLHSTRANLFLTFRDFQVSSTGVGAMNSVRSGTSWPTYTACVDVFVRVGFEVVFIVINRGEVGEPAKLHENPTEATS